MHTPDPLVPVYFTLGCQSVGYFWHLVGRQLSHLGRGGDAHEVTLGRVKHGLTASLSFSCHSKISRPQSQLFMLLFKLSPVFKSLLVTPLVTD